MSQAHTADSELVNGEDKGKRFNKGKTRHDLTTSFAQEQYAKVLTFGAAKYGDFNWTAGMRWSKVLASLERHLQAIKDGHDIDSESGILHSAHVMCNAAFLTEYYKIYPQGDDREAWYKKPLKSVWCDLDGCIIDYEKHFLEYLNLPKDHPTDWCDHRFREEFDKIKHDEKFWSSIPALITPSEITYPIKGYVTSRPISNKVTEEWLRVNGFPKKTLINVDGGKKSEVLKQGDIMVDDSMDNFIDMQSNGITCYLMTRPHNIKYDVGHWRVNNIKEFFDKVKQV